MKTTTSKIILTVLALGAAIGIAIFNLPKPSVAQPLLFGRALFGPDRTNDSAVVHFIVRGAEIFVDKNKDDIPQPGELNQSEQLETIRDAAASYHASQIRLAVNPQFVTEKLPQQLSMNVDVQGQVQYQQMGTIKLSSNPQTPDWIHFHGPTRLIFTEPELPLTQGSQGELRIWVGNNAIGSALGLGSAPKLTDVSTVNSAALDETVRFAHVVPVPGEMVPELQIEIPTDGAPSIETLLMNDFC